MTEDFRADVFADAAVVDVGREINARLRALRVGRRTGRAARREPNRAGSVTARDDVSAYGRRETDGSAR